VTNSINDETSTNHRKDFLIHRQSERTSVTTELHSASEALSTAIGCNTINSWHLKHIIIIIITISM